MGPAIRAEIKKFIRQSQLNNESVESIAIKLDLPKEMVEEIIKEVEREDENSVGE